MFSKDASGNRDGGDLTAFIADGRIKLRFQSSDSEVWMRTSSGSIEAGEEYHLAFSFGEGGARLYLNGVLQDWESDFTQGLDTNTQNLAIGANTWSRNENRPDWARNHFDFSFAKVEL